MDLSETSGTALARNAGAVLLERDVHLASLRSAAAAAAAGHGSVTVLEGPAGGGKTALLDAARAIGRKAGLDVVRARARWIEGGVPYALAAQLMEDALPATARRAAPVVTVAAALGDETLVDDDAGLREALLAALRERGVQQPLLIALDDADLADEASLSFVAHAALRIDRFPAALVLATRAPALGRDPELLEEITRHPDAARVTCTPLSRDATRQWIAKKLHEQPSDDFVTACFEGTAGNPGLMAGLLAWAEAEGVAPQNGSAAVASAAPAAIAERVEFRLRRLGPAALGLARAVAVCGQEAEVRHCAELAELDPQRAAQTGDLLVAAGILAPGDTLSFEQPIVGRSIYAAHPPATRAAAHLQLATLMAGERDDLERVAGHLEHSPRMGQRWVPDTLTRAAGEALGSGEPRRAIGYLERALAEPAREESLARIMLTLGRAEAVAGEPGAVEHLSEAAELIEDPRRRALVSLDIGRALYAQGHVADAAAAFEQGAVQAAGTDRDLRVKLITSGALIARSAGLDHPDLKPSELAVAEHGRPDTSGARVLLARLAFERSVAGARREEVIDLAYRALDGGVLLRDEGPDGLAHHFAALALLHSEDLQGAEVAFAAAAERAAERGSHLGEATARYFRAWSLARRGLLAPAAEEARAVLRSERLGWNLAPRNVRAILGYALTYRGEFDAARAHFAENGTSGTDVPMPLFEILRARFHLASGSPEAALADFRESRARLLRSQVANPSWGAWRSGIALAAHQLGDGADTLALVEEELELARRFGAPGPIARALVAKAAVVDRRRRLATLEEAAGYARESEWLLDRSRILVELGTELRHARKRRAAREPLLEGLDVAERCGARLIVDRARSELLASGARPRRTAVRGVASLTERELEVARLISEGLSNREAAERLFVTVKTVEWHLKNVFMKLEVTSRQELPGALSREAEA